MDDEQLESRVAGSDETGMVPKALFESAGGLQKRRAANISSSRNNAKRTRGSVAHLHRISDFQRIAHDDQRFQT
jgi:hypothetical protein